MATGWYAPVRLRFVAIAAREIARQHRGECRESQYGRGSGTIQRCYRRNPAVGARMTPSDCGDVLGEDFTERV